MTGYVLLVIELAAILVVLVGLALFLGWALGKRSARAKLAAEQETRPTRPTPELEAMTALKDDEKESVSLASRAVPVEAQPAAPQPPSPIAVASTPDSRPKAEVQPVSIPSPFAPDPSLYAGPSASTDPSARGVPAEAKPAGEPQPDLLNDHTVSDESTIDTHMIPRITGQTPPPTPAPAEPDPRLLEAESRANDAEAKAREAEARIEEANQRALEAEIKAQEAEAKIEEAGQQVTQADLRVSEAEARAAEAEARAQQVDQHISDAERARRQVVELEERINKQELDMARLENRATAAWDKTMPNLIERIESLEGDLSQARREAAELQALLAAERDQAAPAPATEQAENPEQFEQPEQAEVPQTEIIKEEPWQAIGTGVAQETPIAFAPSTLDEDAEEQDPEQPEQPGEPVDEVEPDEEPRNEEPEDEKTPDEETENDEETEAEEEVRAPEQLAPTAVVEHEVEFPAPEEKTKDQEQETESQEDHQETENQEEPEQEPAEQEETTDLSALTDTGSFAKLVAPGPEPEDPTPMNLPETEHLVPTAPVYPVTAHHDDATIPDIPRITAPIAQPFGAEEDASGWRRTMTPDTSQPKATDSSSGTTDLLIDETEVDEVPVVAGLPEPGPVAEPSVNAGHIVAPQFGMAGQHDGVPCSPLEPKENQLSISLEEDYTLVDPIDESIAVMDDLGEEFPVGVGIPPEDHPRAR